MWLHFEMLTERDLRLEEFFKLFKTEEMPEEENLLLSERLRTKEERFFLYKRSEKAKRISSLTKLDFFATKEILSRLEICFSYTRNLQNFDESKL